MQAERLRDRALTRRCRETLSRHPRLGRLPLRVSIRGGVAHVSGTLPSCRDLTMCRKTFAGIAGIQAVWDVIAVNGRRPRVVDIGCGTKKQDRNALGLDILPVEGVDVVADPGRGLPFLDGSVDCIFAVHCLEHMAGLVTAMAEIHRVLSPQGVAHIMVPAAGSTNATADPTHIRFFNRQTFKYFCVPRRETPLFAPVIITQTQDNVLADLVPVKKSSRPPSNETLALFFD